MAPHFATIPNNTAKQWWNDPALRMNIFHCFGCMLCPFYLGYDQSLLTGLQSLPKWNAYMGKPAGNWLGLIAACIFLPGIVFGFPASWICRVWGRKMCVYIGSFLIVVGAIWNALSPNVHHFMGSRVIIGAGGSMTKVGAPALLQEIAHPRLRSPLATMYYGFYYTGSLTSGALCLAGYYIKSEWSWRFPCIFIIIGPIAVVSILLFAPESPRFLIKQGKIEEGKAILTKYHANGDENDALVAWELDEIRYTLELEEVSSKTKYSDLIATAPNRKRLIVSTLITVGTNWVGNGIVSYYLTPALKALGVTQATKQLGINVGLAAWNLVLAETAALNVERFGRRPLFLTSTIGMIISYCFVMGFNAGFAQTGNKKLGLAAIPFLFLFYGSYDIAWTPLNYSYPTEIMPYALRTKGLAIYVAFQNAANAFNQFVNPIALAKLTWKYYAVYIAIDVCYVIVIYFYFPETKGLTIEEVSLVFDYPTKTGRKMAMEAMQNRVRQETFNEEDKKSVSHSERV